MGARPNTGLDREGVDNQLSPQVVAAGRRYVQAVAGDFFEFPDRDFRRKRYERTGHWLRLGRLPTHRGPGLAQGPRRGNLARSWSHRPRAPTANPASATAGWRRRPKRSKGIRAPAPKWSSPARCCRDRAAVRIRMTRTWSGSTPDCAPASARRVRRNRLREKEVQESSGIFVRAQEDIDAGVRGRDMAKMVRGRKQHVLGVGGATALTLALAARMIQRRRFGPALQEAAIIRFIAARPWRRCRVRQRIFRNASLLMICAQSVASVVQRLRITSDGTFSAVRSGTKATDPRNGLPRAPHQPRVPTMQRRDAVPLEIPGRMMPERTESSAICFSNSDGGACSGRRSTGW